MYFNSMKTIKQHEQNGRKSVFDFDNYREYLRNYFEESKALNSRYSLRLFSNKLGFSSKDFILRIMNGEKNLTPSSILKIMNGLQMNEDESSYFEALVLLCQATTEEERQQYQQRVNSIAATYKFIQQTQLTRAYQYEIYSHWYYSAIRSIIGMFGFDGNYAALGKKLTPPISAEQTRNSVNLLERVGFIKKDRNGNWVLNNAAITTGDKVIQQAFINYHKECLSLASDSITNFSSSERNISSVTLGISEESYKKIVQCINDFRKKISMIANEDEKGGRVFQMNIQIFPLSK
jgi:uncharacterized protein (TIGR02147 family)